MNISHMVKQAIGVVPLPAVRRVMMAAVSRVVLKRSGLATGSAPPLRTIYLQTRSLCNNTCSFCAASITYQQRHTTRKDILMKDEVHGKIVSDLGAMGFSGRIGYHFNNEPLLDKRLVEFIRQARTACPEAEIDVMTNGLTLTAPLGEQLFEAGLDLLRINNYSDEGAWLPGVSDFMESVIGTMPPQGQTSLNAHMPGNSRQKVMLVMRRLTEVMQNRAGSSPSGRQLKAGLRCSCLLPFNQLVVGATGRVGLCCNDFYVSENMGDLTTRSVAEVWHGEDFKRVRSILSRGDRAAIKLCAQCDYPGF